MKLNLLIFFAGFSLLTACNKNEGPGGTSVIRGMVMGSDHEFGKAEVTEIIVTNGLQIEHGDYWILNTPGNGEYFYIWYDNPDWVSEGDPGLSGRTGIPVEFNYSDSNTEIAEKTAEALNNSAGANFTISVINDVISITTNQTGIVPDADEVTSPFEFNIAEQGENGTLSEVTPMIDERVYIVYGEEEYYSDETRTGPDGEFQFAGLTRGDYTIYVVSKDTITGGNEKIEAKVSITDKKSEIDAGTIKIYH